MMSTKETSHPDHACCSPGYATPADAMQADREKLLYAIALYTRTGIKQPDYLATVDVDPNSPTFARRLMAIVPKLRYPNHTAKRSTAA